MSETRSPNPEQQAAIDARGQVFVSAGAGTGKTTVLVERFARAVCDEGVDVESILAITYTERAAAELRSRVRARLSERGRPELARRLDGAYISTIHGFCLRLLKTHPFAAGLDPRFRVLDDSQSRVLRGEAFTAALADFCAEEEPERLRLLATYGVRGLRRMLTGVYDTLRSAGLGLTLEQGELPSLEVRRHELAEAARCLLGDERASERVREQAEQALALLERNTAPEALLDLGDLRARGERAASYEEARRALEQAALDQLAVRDRALLQALLVEFDTAYTAAKARESTLDFEDLQLAARDLLRTNEQIRSREAWRFRAIMVDEFQDTNRLQCALIDLVARGGAEDVFYVGDEFQSIYGFRHADVGVFRERRRQAPAVLALTRNYRARPEVLAAVNHLFEAAFGDDFQPLAASGEFPDPVFGTPVELLVTDKSALSDTGVHWRRAEARHVADRIRELVDSGAARPGEIVLLFAAGSDAEWYEEELRARGLPTHRSTGRSYFGQQQVVDLLAYLRLLHNRYDDEALVSVLASPLVGVSNDCLVLLRRAAPKRPLFTGLERGLPPHVSDTDAQLCRAFLQRYERLAALAPRLSLERLCERIVSEHDYDLAVLAQWDGRRRYANLRKLARLARSYEELRGPDVEGFVRFVRDQEAVGARELEAVAEEEDADAVRLLTIHAAKGLEFKVVVVADAGRDRAGPSADEILALPDGRVGLRVADPATGRRRGALAYDEVKEEEARGAEAERRRLYYVAMTRAIDRLLVSGSIDPTRGADAATPIGWVLERLGLDVEQASDAPVEIERDGARLLVRVNRSPGEPAGEHEEAGVPAEHLQLELFAAGAPLGGAPPPAPVLPPLLPVAAPPLHRVRRLSYSALALFERCSYRYYAERVVGMPPADASGRRSGDSGLAATEIGDAVHAVLETIDLRSPVAPASDALAASVRARYPAASAEELERIGRFVSAYVSSELAARIAGLPGAVAERPFTFEHDGVLLHGRIDVLHRAGDHALVLDYKTNTLAEYSPSELVESDYRLQRLVYALACFRAGARSVEVIYHFLERSDAVVSTRFSSDDRPALEAELSAAIAEIQAGRFSPTPGELACAGCPALDLVCAGPRLHAGSLAGPAALVAARG
ncbi:MAG: UvrD-helicase domain-containing protein [Actinobacteria bacterium]|nr:UvrD-helicase domain-containing protein [Actinomycetota bacterium]